MTGIWNGIQHVIAFIKSIMNAIETIWGLLRNLLVSLIDLVRLLANIVANATTLIATLPSWLIAFAECTLGVAVIYMILGRQSGKSD